MKILFLISRSNGGSARFRVLSYLPHFKKRGISCTIDSFIFPEFHEVLYKRGCYFRKILFIFIVFGKVFKNLFRAFFYDIIFIQKKFLIIGPGWFERFLCFIKPVIYDLDDAIFLKQNNHSNIFQKLNYPQKIKKIISSSKYVIAGNSYLASYAKKYNKNVRIIPTAIDTEIFILKTKQQKNGPLVIGWIGSHSTLPYLMESIPLLKKVADKYNIKLKFVSDHIPDIKVRGLEIETKDWSPDEEVKDLQSFDIGIMPQPNNDWVRGKCGFKAIQYMASGVPCVASNVGINQDIINDGYNGFLASTKEEWVKKISKLIESPKLQNKFIKNGRKTIEERFSVQTNLKKYLTVFRLVGND